MKNYSVRFFTVFVVCFCSISCASTIPFTHEIIGAIGDESMKDFQYYISDGVLLTKVEQQGAATVTGGQAVISRSRKTSEIWFDSSTLCKLMGERWNNYSYAHPDGTEENLVQRRLDIGFEQLADGTIPIIEFATWGLDPDKFYNGEYDEERFYLVYHNNENGDAILNYNGAEYRVTYPDGREINIEARPYLNIKIKTSEKESKNRRKVKGLKV